MFYPDVQARGTCPSNMSRYFTDINIKMKEGDDKILKEGTVDFVSISCYMTYQGDFFSYLLSNSPCPT
jgi:6-phospho-beta-glucosidase